MSGCESSELIVIEEPEKLFKLPKRMDRLFYGFDSGTKSTDRNKHFLMVPNGFYIIDEFGNIINKLRDYTEILEDKEKTTEMSEELKRFKIGVTGVEFSRGGKKTRKNRKNRRKRNHKKSHHKKKYKK